MRHLTCVSDGAGSGLAASQERTGECRHTLHRLTNGSTLARRAISEQNWALLPEPPRAYCHTDQKFKDFILPRILETRSPGAPGLPGQDD